MEVLEQCVEHACMQGPNDGGMLWDSNLACALGVCLILRHLSVSLFCALSRGWLAAYVCRSSV